MEARAPSKPDVGWLALLICGCVLCQIHFDPEYMLPAGAGGIVGDWLTSVGSPVFGWIGLTLLCLTGVLTGAQAAGGFSWVQITETTGRVLHRASAAVVGWLDRQLDRVQKIRPARAVVGGRLIPAIGQQYNLRMVISSFEA